MKGVEAFLRAAAGAPRRRGIDAFLEGTEFAAGPPLENFNPFELAGVGFGGLEAGIPGSAGSLESNIMPGAPTDVDSAFGTFAVPNADQIFNALAPQRFSIQSEKPRPRTVIKYLTIDGFDIPLPPDARFADVRKIFKDEFK